MRLPEIREAHIIFHAGEGEYVQYIPSMITSFQFPIAFVIAICLVCNMRLFMNQRRI